MTRSRTARQHGTRGTGQASHPTAEQSKGPMEAGLPVTTPRSCIGNEAEEQGHLEKEGTALTSSLNSELAEYLLKKSLPLIGKFILFSCH